MMNYLQNWHGSLNNNASENSSRPLFVGRKNFLFSDIQDVADATMMAYMLIEMAKASGLDPRDYINYILSKRPSAEMSADELERLMPWKEEVVQGIASI